MGGTSEFWLNSMYIVLDLLGILLTWAFPQDWVAKRLHGMLVDMGDSLSYCHWGQRMCSAHSVWCCWVFWAVWTISEVGEVDFPGELRVVK